MTPNFLKAALAVAFLTAFRFLGYQVLASDRVSAHRKSICDACPKRVGDQCGVCTCFIDAKVVLNSEKCPLGFWGRVWKRKHRLLKCL